MNNLSFDFGGNTPSMKRKIIKNIIVDRKSKYTVILAFVESKKQIDDCIHEILKDKYFQKATHNSYAYRVKQENGSILEGKNDDGETGAGLCILREIQRANFVNTLVVVTRYFGGIHLQNDRFKHVINATKAVLGQ